MIPALFNLLLESYCLENTALFRYLRDKPVSISNHWQELHWEWSGWQNLLDYLNLTDAQVEKLIDQDRMFDDFCPQADQIISDDSVLLDSYISFMMQEHPAEAPSWAHLQMNADRLLPSNTWLVHWTDNAVAVAQEGFNHGISDIDRLGLTAHLGDKEKQFGGYNFAYLANHRHAVEGGKYGDECVIFQSSGVQAHHWNDDEHQVVFWGAGVSSSPVPIVPCDGGFAVYSKNLGRNLVKFDSVEDCWLWVRHHRRQYQAALA